MGMIGKVMAKTAQLFANRSNAAKIAYLRRHGCHLGADVRLNCKVEAFNTEPYLITLGDQVLIAPDVRFFTHDGGVNVLQNLHKEAVGMDKMAPIRVGNNVYIGTGAYILPGVRIGDNCVIGAGAIVTKDIPSGNVAVGIPARVTESVEDYWEHTQAKHCLYATKSLSPREKRAFYEALDLRKQI